MGTRRKCGLYVDWATKPKTYIAVCFFCGDILNHGITKMERMLHSKHNSTLTHSICDEVERVLKKKDILKIRLGYMTYGKFLSSPSFSVF